MEVEQINTKKGFPLQTMNSSKYFDEEILSCPHCGWQPDEGIEEELLEFLDKLQEQVEQPLEIVACARCKEYNDEIGGYENSYHVQGMAVDIAVPDDMVIEEFADLCEECGAEGIVLKYDDNFVHVDMRGHIDRYEE
jgi:hypothetical protein